MPSLSEAQPIIIQAGKTITAIDAALQPAPAGVGEGEPREGPNSPGEFPNGTGGTGPVTAPYLEAANNELNAIAVRDAELRAKDKEAEEEKAREAGARPASELGHVEEAQQDAPNQVERPACRVPALRGDTLNTASRALTKAHCRLGKVSRPRGHHKTLVVADQGTKRGKTLVDGSAIAVTLSRIA